MNIKKHPEFDNPTTIRGKKTAVFAGDTSVWLLIESTEEDEDAFEFNGTWWRKAVPDT